ncbi:MAG: GAF domain-containing protein [Acetobacteraceae bacterium]
MTAPHRAAPDLETMIAQLRAERDAALAREGALEAEKRALLAELAAGRDACTERIEHQAATIDVLKVMAASPGDPQPVFDLIAVRARDLCDAYGVTVFEYDGTLIHWRAATGVTDDPNLRNAVQATYPRPPTRDLPHGRAILDGRIVLIPDIQADPGLDAIYRHFTPRSIVSVPIIHNGIVIGALGMGRLERGEASSSQIELLKTFAEQAAIAISSADTCRWLQVRTADLQEALEQQTATTEILQVVNTNAGHLGPVFDVILDNAMRLCQAAFGSLYTFDGETFHSAAQRGVPAAYARFRERNPPAPTAQTMVRILQEKKTVHVLDLMEGQAYQAGDQGARAMVELGGIRTILTVPLLKENAVLGIVSVFRQQVRAFTDKQIALLENFAAHAVIAMENARLLTEQQEALEQQTSTAEVLGVINASPGNLKPVFDTMLERAMRFCGGAMGGIFLFEGEHSVTASVRGVPPAFADYNAQHPLDLITAGSVPARIIETKRPTQRPDIAAGPGYRAGHPFSKALVELGGIRSVLAVPLLKDDSAVGMIAIYRQEVGTFADKQVGLLENFAAQAVIAMENARLLDELRQRQHELRVTFENMGDGVAMFDEDHRLVAWNRRFQEILALPRTLLEQACSYESYLQFLAARGDFGAGVDTVEQIEKLVATTGRPYGYERSTRDGRVIEVRRNPAPDGGFVLIFSDITERKRSEAEINAAREAAEVAYRDLQAAQANLIQAEKMASLGQLTAGIAHEIKNPLNFVNNFAALSVDLLDELKQAAEPGFASLDADERAEVQDLTQTLTDNLRKIEEHGRRADAIVRSMLEHSRTSSGERRVVDLNALVDEALNLAYHGARAHDQGFTVTLVRNLAAEMAPIEVSPQDLTRVFLNLLSNAFYAVTSRARNGQHEDYTPTVTVSTRDTGDTVEVHVRDNGTGIPAEIRDKLFQPFFTTKPTGDGTGLGLSITYDIVTKAHRGSIRVESQELAFSEFVVTLPRVVQAATAPRPS